MSDVAQPITALAGEPARHRLRRRRRVRKRRKNKPLKRWLFKATRWFFSMSVLMVVGIAAGYVSTQCADRSDQPQIDTKP